jgi:ribonuclease Z
MRFEVTILGCSSATPTSNRYPTAQVLNILERFFLIDCGEGTQMQLRRYKQKLQRINHIFISHLHGDHYFGLIGLVSTMHLLGRKTPLDIFCHPDLEQIIKIQLKASDTRLQYELRFHHLSYDSSKRLVDDTFYTVDTIILKHRIPCCGFLFREKPRLRSLRKDKLQEFDVPVSAMEGLRRGEDFTTADGQLIPNKEITIEPPAPRAYAFCSDTAYNESLVSQIEGVDLLYHEATFTSDRADRAAETFHSTAMQAATIAQKAKVQQLMIGHYSARYKDFTPLVEEARSVFANTIPAEEGKTYTIG